MAEIPNKPITRKETYLAAIAGQNVDLPRYPITREEAYLDEIAKNGGGGGGTSDYTALTNKPSINGVELSGNKTASQLGMANSNTFQGTIAEWNQLSTAEKKAYDHASIPDSIDGGVTFPADKVVMTGGGNVEDAIASGLNNLIVAEDRTLNFSNGACYVEIPTGYILLAAIGVATDNFIFGYTITSGTTGYRLALSNNASVSLLVRLVYASQYATLNT